MMRLYKIIATSLGIGYIGKGAGTVAAIFTCVCWYFAAKAGLHFHLAVIVTAIVIGLGIWSGNEVEAEWGKDDKKVVIDEVAGMCISLLGLPVSLKLVIVGLILFRFFDIAKPLLIRKTERFRGGWGVMLDDMVAGLYANILLQVMVHVKWLS